jgi:hypothetical protein
MTRHFKFISMSLASAAVIAIAGFAFANVPNDVFLIADKDSSTAVCLNFLDEGLGGGTCAELDLAGSGYELDVIAICDPFLDGDLGGSAVAAETDHPDEAKLKKNKGEIGQTQKDNRVDVAIITGQGEAEILNFLACEKAEMEGDVKTKKSPNSGSFSFKGKNCTCIAEGDFSGPDGCLGFSNQLGILAVDCEDNKTVTGSFKDGDLKKLEIKGKGDALNVTEIL